ncbi:MAG: hypothetical protein AAFY02_14375 [Pseudomonadota bacterium]
MKKFLTLSLVSGSMVSGALVAGALVSGSMLMGSDAHAAEDCERSVDLIMRTQQNPAPAAGNPMTLCLDDADANQDGQIDESEWQTLTGGLFQNLDQDSDKGLSVEEINRLQTRN